MAKPISEKQVDLLVERLVNRVQKANEKFLKEIGKKIDEISKLTPSDAHKLTQILDYGGNYDEMVKQIDMYTQKNIAEIDDIFSKYAQKDAQFYEQFYQYKNIPFEEYSQNNALKTQTEALTRLVKNEMYDFTRQNVLGYTIKDLNGNEQFYTLRDTYNSVLDEAFMHVGQGKLTFDEGMSSVLSQLGESGLKTINYTSGRSIRLDSAVKMHLKNRLSELHNENEQLFGEEFGADGVEISVHDNPAPDHASVQGRQFSKEQYDRLQKGLVAKDYKGIPRQITHSKKGSYRPISEMNCYHTIYPIVLGVSEPTYSEEQLEEIEQNNEAGFELDGNKYTMYEGTQLQRELERRIRGQKDIQILAKECKNNTLIAKSQTQITYLVNKYNELCQVSGLPPKTKRMQVKGYKRTKVEPTINITKTKQPQKPIYTEVDDIKLEQLNKETEQKFKKLDEKDFQAVKNYKGTGYKEINETIMQGEPSDYDLYTNTNDIKADIKRIDNVLQNNTIKDDIIVYKGTTDNYYKDFAIGEEFEIPVFNSTTAKYSISERFARLTGYAENSDIAILEIRVPKGTNGLYLGDNFSMQDEREFLLPRNLKYKLVDKQILEESGMENGIYVHKKKKTKFIIEVVK